MLSSEANKNIKALKSSNLEFDRAFDNMKLQRVAIDIFRNLPELFIVINLEGKIIFWNRNFEELLGLEPSELHRKPLFDFVCPEDKERTLKAFEEVKENSGKLARPFRNRYLTKKGEKVLLQWNEKNPVSEGCIVATAKHIKE